MLDEIPEAFLVAAETTGTEDLGSVFLHKRQMQMIIDKYINIDDMMMMKVINDDTSKT